VPVQITSDGEGIANHVGKAALRELTDVLGFGAALSRGLTNVHVLRDLVVMLAAGEDCVRDLASLRDRPELFGEVVSAPAWQAGRPAATAGRPAPSTVAAAW
jgi:hypothetical protein